MVCKEIFDRIDVLKNSSTEDIRCEVTVSMLEIYNEHV